MVEAPRDHLKEVLAVSTELDLDPIQDVELFWVIEEYLSAPLPEGWLKVKTPSGEETFVNSADKVTVRDNPIKNRFKRIVQLIKHCQQHSKVVDEITLLELWTPIAKIDDLLDMAKYLQVDPVKEQHLMWIPKLAILEGLPEGWKEVRNADGSVHYLDTLTNTPSDEHPLDKHFLKLLQHERGKRKPTMSLQPELYEWQPEVAFESEIAPEKQKDKWFFRTVEKMAASGNHIGYFDAFGQQRWYDPVTKTETDVTHEVKILPAVITLQRFWRSYCVRKEIWVLHHAACVIGRAIKNRRFRKIVKKLQQDRINWIVTLQKFVRNRIASVETSKELYRRLGSIGSRPGKRSVQNVSSLLASGHSFLSIRRKVVLIQRTFREYRASKALGEGP